MKRSIFCFASAVLLANCSAPPGLSLSAARPSERAEAPRTSSGPQRLYVAECCGVLNTGDVVRYGPSEGGIAHRYVNGAHFPLQIAIDDSGTLYVLNESNLGPQGIAITEYDRGSPQRSRRIGYFYWATNFALDRKAKVYVANCNTCTYSSSRPRAKPLDSVTIYQRKGTQLLGTITDGIYEPQALAFDQSQNLYVSNAGTRRHSPSVTVYAPGSTTPMLTITKEITRPGTLGFDRAGNLYVADGQQRVVEYAPASDRILRTIRDGIRAPQALQFGRYGRLYVANWPPSGTGWISVYSPGSTTPAYEIKNNVQYPVSMVLDGKENLYVANLGNYGDSWVSVYEPSDGALIKTIRGGKHGPPRSLAFGVR